MQSRCRLLDFLEVNIYIYFFKWYKVFQNRMKPTLLEKKSNHLFLKKGNNFLSLSWTLLFVIDPYMLQRLPAEKHKPIKKTSRIHETSKYILFFCFVF